MKNLSGKTLLRGDSVIGLVGESVHVGVVQEFYDRTNQIRISGYALRLNANETVLATDAWASYGQPLLDKARSEAAEAARKAAEPKTDTKAPSEDKGTP